MRLIASNNYLTINKDMIKLIGLNNALVLSELCSEFNYYQKENKLIDNMFFSSQENISNNIGLSKRQISESVNFLEKKGLIKTKLKGLPAIKHYEIIECEIMQLLNVDKCNTSVAKNDILELQKTTLNNNKLNNNNYKEKNILLSINNNIQKNDDVEKKSIFKIYQSQDLNESIDNYLKMRKRKKYVITDRVIKKLEKNIDTALELYSIEKIIDDIDNATNKEYQDIYIKEDFNSLTEEDILKALKVYGCDKLYFFYGDFILHYQKNGWKDVNGNKIIDWRPLAYKWNERAEKEKKEKQNGF
jgi:hypothetical protein